MNKALNSTEFADALLRREEPVPEAQYAEYRRRLADRVARAARRERLARLVTIATCFLAAVGLVLGMLVDRSALPWPVKEAYFIAVSLAAGCAPLLLLLYFLRHRPALGRARDESQTALLLDLRRELEDLRRRIPREDQRP